MIAMTAKKHCDQKEASRIAINVQREADRVIMAKHEQAGVVINEAMEVLQFRGDTSDYLMHAPGAPNWNLLKMAREGLLTEVIAIKQVIKMGGGSFKKENIRIKCNGNFKTISIEVIPLRIPAANQRHFLISFTEQPQVNPPSPAQKTIDKTESKPSSRERYLEEELISTKTYMQSIIAAQEATNAELQADNADILRSKEELRNMYEDVQSANEELQTTKEMLQTSNEELMTVNDNFKNLLNSIRLPTMIVGNDLQIRVFTAAIENFFNLVATDVGRSIHDIKLRVEISNLEELILQVIKDLTIKEREVQDTQGRRYSLQIRPNQTIKNKVDGVVITFVDIDSLKRNNP